MERGGGAGRFEWGVWTGLGGGAGANPAGDFFAPFPLGYTEVVVRLEREPGLGSDAEVGAEAECSVRGDCTCSVDDGADAVRRDVEIAGQLIDADFQGLHEIFQEDFTGVDRDELCTGHAEL